MSPTDTVEATLSETEAGRSDIEGANLKLVPVAESIRYRKRAQSAESKAETLAEQLAQVRSEARKIAEQLSSMQVEQKLMRKLAAAGTVDLEAAVLVAKARVKGETDADLNGVIEQLKREKRYLFADHTDGIATANKTAGAKDRTQSNQPTLERAAQKAATTGNRSDLQEYLKLRRNFV